MTQVQHYLKNRGWGFSRAVSMGNSSDLDLCDGLDYLAQDPETASIALYIEGVRDGKAFLSSARRASAVKPVVAFYVGGTDSGARVSASHTGALAGDGMVYSGAFAQAGVVEVHGVEKLYASAHALANQPPMRGPRVGIITNSGGPAASIADALTRNGLALPEFSHRLQERLKHFVPPTAPVKNPVDVTFSLDTEAFLVSLVDEVLGSGEVDALVIHGVIGSLYMDELAEMVGDMVVTDNSAYFSLIGEAIERSVAIIRRHGLPVVISAFWGQNDDSSIRAYHQAGIPCHLTPELAVDSLKALYIRGNYLNRPA